MSYISAAQKSHNTVITWERDEDGYRFIKKHKAPYYFYAPDDNGEFTSTRGEKLKKVEFDSKNQYEIGIHKYTRTFESDFNPVERVLMDKYYKAKIPNLHFTLLDIETDYHTMVYEGHFEVQVKRKSEEDSVTITVHDLRELDQLPNYEVYDDMSKGWVSAELSKFNYTGRTGWSRPENTYAPINAITFFHIWKNEYITLAVPPPEWNRNKSPLNLNGDILKLTNLILCEDEKELLLRTLDIIEDTDVLSGWNSEMFDLPYLVKRTEEVLGERYIKRWCFPEAKEPYYKEVMKFGKTNITVQLHGRNHLDYLQLFKKFTFEGRPSFSLSNIANDELKDTHKLTYDGTLENLYHYNFELFLEYNFVDVQVMEKLETKFKFLQLANSLMHANTVQMGAVLGSVQLIDSGIINHCHYELNTIVDNRTNNPDIHIEGAMVFTPRVGLWHWIGSIDIKSLYPSTYRALNISPDTLIGQFEKNEDDWCGVVDKDDINHILWLDSGESLEMTGKKWSKFLKKNNMSISAYGTVFDLSKQGFIPAILESWYNQRVELKGHLSKWKKIQKKLKEENKIDTEEYKTALEKIEYYDLQQLIKKVLLNSCYGATLHSYCRFHDHRLGSSTTYTGKKITQHMANVAGKLLTSEDSEVIMSLEEQSDGSVKKIYTCTSEAIIYGDTDSIYFKIADDDTRQDQAIEIADTIGELVNNAFTDFMEENFYCTGEFKKLIECEREVVASTGIFLARKRYALRCVNIDGYDIEPGSKKEIKAMGLETKKSDTPKYIQSFLKEVLIKILYGEDYNSLQEYINNFRIEFNDQPNRFLFGITRSVNKLNMYQAEYDLYERDGTSKVRLPGHVRATINHNNYIEDNNEKDTMQIQDEQKVSIFYLRFNDDKFKSIAICADEDHFPDWFLEDFEIDMEVTEHKLIDAKVDKIFKAINWEIPSEALQLANDVLEF